MTLSRLFAIAGLLTATLGIAAAAPPVSETEDAVYQRRFAAAPGTALDSYDVTEAVPGAPRFHPLPKAAHPSISPRTIDAARDYASANNSSALLIWRDGALETAFYGKGIDAGTLLNARSMAKPVGAIAVGRAIQLGAIKSLDEPVADFITEWRGTPKAAILVRHLLNMTAGLLQQGQSLDPANILNRAYLHPRHDEILIHEYPLTNPPGSRYLYSNASAELVAIVIERATRRRYAEFVSTEVLKPLGAEGGKLWVDRPGGLTHAGCCILLPAETFLRLGLLLMDDGVWHGRRLLPVGYVDAMKTGSASNPRYGLGVWIQGEYTRRRGFGGPELAAGAVLHGEPYLASDLFLFDGNQDQVLYMIPSRHLAILRMGAAPPHTPEWDNVVLPNLVLRDLAASRSPTPAL